MYEDLSYQMIRMAAKPIQSYPVTGVAPITSIRVGFIN